RARLGDRWRHLLKQPSCPFGIVGPQLVKYRELLAAASLALVIGGDGTDEAAVGELELTGHHGSGGGNLKIVLDQLGAGFKDTGKDLLLVVGATDDLSIRVSDGLPQGDDCSQEGLAGLLGLTPQPKGIVPGIHQGENNPLMLGKSPRPALLVQLDVSISE